MNIEHCELHNIEELEDRGPLGRLVHRFPRAVREHPDTSDLGRLVMQKALGSEIRLVTPAPRIRISLGALEQDNQVVVLKGDFVVGHHIVPAGRELHLLVNRPESYGYFTPAYFQGCRFHPDVWRIWMGQEVTRLLGLDTLGSPLRPPRPEEKPRRRWLAYGSSFTMGGGAGNQFNNYVNIASRLLGVDGLNLGLGGSCLCERHVADYLAARRDWDFCTLRVGTNMLGLVEPDEYRRRVEYLLDTVLAGQPGKPVVFIGLGLATLPLHREHKIWQEHAAAYHRLNQEILGARRTVPNLFHCTQDDLMPDHTLVRADQLHPDDLGYFTIATRLAERLRQWGIANT